MDKRICMVNIIGQCRNPSKNSGAQSLEGLVCPYCLREDGKDGHGTFITEPEKAVKLFHILKDKVKE